MLAPLAGPNWTVEIHAQADPVPSLSASAALAPGTPSIVLRDENGRPTVRAIRVASLEVDGRLDEPLYETVIPMSDFVQTEPQPGSAATERTDVWVSFDDDHIYVTVRAWESQPERMIVNEMRRDSETITENENFAFVLDTYHDGRNGVMFSLNPNGGRMDGQLTNESQYNGDWNPVWDLAVGRFDGGWTAEAALPFKSLRYHQTIRQIWGFNARRINRWKNEISFLSPVADGQGVDGLQQVSRAGVLVDLEVPARRQHLEVKPYAIADVTSTVADGTTMHAIGGDAGLDLKYGVTDSLTADFTYNTDFAQVEADEEQINLTRFSLFFPEKREFFLENQGLFQFGGASGSGDVPILFYSRRIGLDGNRVVPIDGGGRLTGRIGSVSVGALNIQTDDTGTGTNYSAFRVKQDILRRSSVGALYTRRSLASDGGGANEAFGVDAALRFYDNVAANLYWARTRTAGRPADGSDTSYRLHFNYNGDRYGYVYHRVKVGEAFDPGVGFVFRENFSKNFSRFRFSPRLTRVESIRKLRWEARVNYFEDGSGRLVTRELQGDFAIEFENSDLLEVTYMDVYDRLEDPFRVAGIGRVPIGQYDFGTLQAAFTLGQQRTVSGQAFVERGSFYGGDKTTLGYSQGRIGLTPQVSVEPNVSVNWIALPSGSFTTSLVSSRITYTITPLMFVSGLLQYASSAHAMSTNVRLRWEYQPGSELFVVYNETRDTARLGFPGLENRALIVKVNRLVRF